MKEIDEVIQHCLEVAEEQSRLYSLCPCPCDGTDNCMSLKMAKTWVAQNAPQNTVSLQSNFVHRDEYRGDKNVNSEYGK
jgi:hypothetical protein